jgi:hypothetical protein
MENPDNFGHRVTSATGPNGSAAGYQTSVKAAHSGALGNTAKSVRHFSQDPQQNKANSENRSVRFKHQRHAAALLGGKARVGLCRWSVVSKDAGVEMVASSYKDGTPDRVHYEGLGAGARIPGDDAHAHGAAWPRR